MMLYPHSFGAGLRALASSALALCLCCLPSACAAQEPQPLRPGSGWLVPGGSRPLGVPVRVLLAGDSLMEGLGPQMRDALSGYSNLTFYPIGKKSTGLSRPDFYDWPAVLRARMSEVRPHVVVMWVGTNDPQGIYGRPDAGEPLSRSWQLVYLEKLREIFAIVRQHGARLILMGPPVVGKPKLNGELGSINRLMEWACKRHDVCYVNTRVILGDKQERFYMQGYLPNGQKAVLRTPDQVHITAEGNKRVMAYLLPYVAAEIQRCFPSSRTPRRVAPRGGTTISGRR